MRTVATVVLGCALAAGILACNKKGETAAVDDGVVSLLAENMMHFSEDVASDGRLTFSKAVNGAGAIFVTDSQGRNARQISNGVWDGDPRFSPDGQWVAFNRDDHAQDVLYVSASGGEPHVVANSGLVEVLIGWLPDNSGIVYGKVTPQRYETWVYMLADSSTRPLIDVQDGGFFAIPSPDGKWIAYEFTKRGERTIWLHDVGTGARRQLTTEGYENLPLEGRLWSHDSRRLLYISTRSGMPHVWLADIETGQLRQVTSDVRGDFQPIYHPKASQVLFISNRGGQVDVWMVADSGGQATRVTDNVAREYRALWSADGNEVVVLGSESHNQLYVVPSDSGAPTQLSTNDYEVLAVATQKSGNRIVFEHDQGDVDIYSMPMSGGPPTKLASSPGRDFDPDISPDGRLVMFSSTRNGESDLYVVPMAGGEARALTTGTARDDQGRWSPDGKWIAFTSNRSASSDLWIMDSAGGNVRRLTNGFNVPDPGQWSNSGKQIAVTGNTPGGRRVAIYDVATGRSRMLDSALSDPEWSPDDSLIVAANLKGGFGHIELWTPDGKIVRRLTSEPKTYARGPDFSPDGKWVSWVNYEFATDYYDIVVAPVDGGPIRRLTALKGGIADYDWLDNGRTIALSGITYKPQFYRKRVPAAGTAAKTTIR